MFQFLIFPQRLHATVLRDNIANFFSVFLGILSALPLRNIFSAESLSPLIRGIRNVFLYGETYSYVSSAILAFLPVALLVLLAYTVFGRHCVSAVFFFYAFFRTFISCVFIRAFSSIGILYALLSYGLCDLFVFPGLCISACLSVELSSSVAKSCRGGGRIDIRRYTTELLSGFLFPLLGVFISYIAISLYQMFL